MLMIVPLLLLSFPLPRGAHEPGMDSDAHATTSHQTHSPSAPSDPVDVAEGETELPAPCGMAHCVDMISCAGAGTAVGAHAADLPTWTVAAPGDIPLILTFQTATRTAVPPPPRI